MATFIDRLGGVRSELAIKGPVRVATTAAITLSGFQTIDGVTLADGDANLRVLVKDQTDQTTNGVYEAQSRNWTRVLDFDGNNDFVYGTRLLVTYGSTNQGQWIVSAADPITVGTSNLTFTSALAIDNDPAGLTELALTELALADDAADYLTIYDASATGSKKILGKNLGFTQSGTSATLRSLQSKLREWRTLEDFGAVGDNSTDNTSAIQAAINSGEVLVVGDGLYRHGDLTVANKDFTLLGHGPGLSRLVYTGTNIGLDISQSDVLNETFISGVSFNAGHATLLSGTALRITYPSSLGFPRRDASLHNVDVRSNVVATAMPAYDKGIVLTNCPGNYSDINVTLYANATTSTAGWVINEGLTDSNWTNCWTYYGQEGFLFSGYSEGMFFHHCRAINTGYGFRNSNTSDGILSPTFSECLTTCRTRSIWLTKAPQTKILGCALYQDTAASDSACIEIAGSSPLCHIVGNHLLGTGGGITNGIVLGSGVIGSVVSDNNAQGIFDSGGVMIWLKSRANYNTGSNNVEISSGVPIQSTLDSGTSNTVLIVTAAGHLPMNSNAVALGSSAQKYKDVYATNVTAALAACTGLPISTGVSGLGTGVATFLATPSSANFAAAITDESGTGSVILQAVSTFTPVLKFGGATTGITYGGGGQQGQYIKQGRVVNFWIYISLTNKGSATGSATITGMPFTADTDAVSFYGAAMPFVGVNTSMTSPGGFITNNTTTITLKNFGGTDLDNTNFQNTTDFIITGTYATAS